MKKIILICIAGILPALSIALTDITVGTDNMTTWASKIHSGFRQTEAQAPAGWTLYATNISASATTNALTVTNWTGSTLAENCTVVASDGTAQVLSGGIYTLNLSGTINPDGTNTLQLYNGTNAIAQTAATFTETNAFRIAWPVALAENNTVTLKISATETNKTATLESLKFFGVK